MNKVTPDGAAVDVGRDHVVEVGTFSLNASAVAKDRPTQLSPVADRPSSSWTLRWVSRRSHLAVGADTQPLHRVPP
jgi:hypothetical protein